MYTLIVTYTDSFSCLLAVLYDHNQALLSSCFHPGDFALQCLQQKCMWLFQMIICKSNKLYYNNVWRSRKGQDFGGNINRCMLLFEFLENKVLFKCAHLFCLPWNSDLITQSNDKFYSWIWIRHLRNNAKII